MPGLAEASGQDVLEEAANELHAGDGRGAAVLGREGDLAVFHGEEARVGDPHAVGVEAEVAEDLLGAGEGFLGVGDPFLAVELVFEEREGLALEFELVRLVAVAEGDLAPLDSLGKESEQLASEELGEDEDGEEELAVVARSDPTRAVERRPPPVTMQWTCGKK